MQDGNFNIGGAPESTIQGPAHQALPAGANGRPMAPASGQPSQRPEWPQYSPGGQPQQQSAPQQAAPVPMNQPIQQSEPYQFNDGLQLGGPVGGYQAPAPTPAIQPPQQPQFQTQQPAAPFQASPYQPTNPQPYQQPSAAPAPWQPQPATQQPPQFEATIPMAPPTTAVRDQLVQQGYQVGAYTSDEQLLRDIASASNEASELRRLAAVGQQALSGQQQIQPQQQQPTQQPAASQQDAWQPEWNSLIELDPTSGAYVPKKGHELVAGGIAQQANVRAARQRERAEQLVDNPLEFLKGAGLTQELQAIEERVLAKFEQNELDRQAAHEATSFFHQHDHLLHQRGQDGRPAIGINGQPILTPLGQVVEQQKSAYSDWFQRMYNVEPDVALIYQNVKPLIQQAASQATSQIQPTWGEPTNVPQQPQQWQAPQQANGNGQYQYGQPQQAAPPQAPWQQQPQQQYHQAPQAQQPGVINQAVNNAALWQPQPNGTIANAANNASIPQDASIDFKESLRQSAIQHGVASPDAFWTR